ncbi:hypothetical protein [Pseudonocardia sp. H11422]|uniref:hypothetical protein n=1 Tax=Pseudonocardia sp. H11422 TaxID=2835866 RepID=UPI001BDBF7F3|nr:hypothetical protein [Pseudonocardia sp. H11422]
MTVRRLADGSPSVAAMLREHEDDNDGEVLPYLLLAGIARWYVAGVDERDAGPSTLPHGSDVLPAYVKEMPEALRNEVLRMQEWRPSPPQE